MEFMGYDDLSDLDNKVIENPYKKDIEYANKFKPMRGNNIVTLHNTTVGVSSEVFEVECGDNMLYLETLADYVTFGFAVVGQFETIISFFRNMDKAFKDYLGIGGCPSEEEAIAEIQRLLDKEKDGRHKYYVIQKQFGQPIGLFYVYEYHQKYNRCSIAIGLSPEYRGKGLSEKVISNVCNELLSQGMIRISLETETTNTSSLNCCEKLCNQLGFKKEGILRNLYGKGIDSVVYSLLSEK